VSDKLVNTDGFVDLSAEKTLVCAGLDAYYETQLLGRLSYATVNTLPTIL
jgi:hypothetical protein